KPISIPNEEFSNDTTPSVARKFLNEAKSTIVTLQRVVKQRMTVEIHNWSSFAHQELHKIVKDEIFPIVNQVDARVQNFKIQFLKEAAKFVGDFKSLAKEADESLAKHKALELEIKHLLRAVFSQDIMSVMQNIYVGETSNLQTELERTKERFENCIIKKKNEYAKLWNDWYKKCEECKFDKISYDKAYNDMQQNIERLQAHLGDLKDKSKDTSCVSDTLNPLSQKLENENVQLEFQDTACGKSANTKFAKQSNLGKPPNVGETHALSKLLTSNSIPTSQRSKVMKNDKVIAPGMFSINPFKPSREEKHVPNKVRASVRTNPITISQLPVITKKVVNSDSNGTVRFRNDHVVAILGFGDLQWENILITRVYFVEGLGHNLFSVGQFYDSDLERLHILHMDLCGLMRIASINEKLVLEQRNWTLVEAARTMLIFSRAPLFLWAEAIATACFTQNRSIIHRRFNKTQYELINGRKLDISFLYVFGALCYPKNDHEDIRKLGAKGDIGFFIGYSADSYAYRVFNRWTKKIMGTMNVSFDELSTMAFEQRSLKPGLQSTTSGQISSGLDLTYAPSTITTQQQTEGELDLLFEAMYDDYIGGQPSTALRSVLTVQAHQENQAPIQPQTVTDNVLNAMFDANTFVNPFATSSTSAAESSSSQYMDPSNVYLFYQPYPPEFQWTKDHPLEQVIGEPSRPVLIRKQLRSDSDMCMYTLTVSTMKQKNFKEAMTDPAWIESMQEELL
nr:hypothetical protein [Tanacetum cinerariifolium]